MRGVYGQLEVDELTQESLEFLNKGSLGDRMRAYEQFKDDAGADSTLLKRLKESVSKEYGRKFSEHTLIMDTIITDEEKAKM